MTHPPRLTPEEAVKAVMWILMCSNDLLFVLGAFFLAEHCCIHVRVTAFSSSGVTCKSDHAYERGDGANDVSK